MKKYKYIGPENLLSLVKETNGGKVILSQQDVLDWISDTNQELDGMNQVTVTFIINIEGQLLIADRHSEHVACAGGKEVLSAGEMTFEIDGSKMRFCM